MGEHLDSPQRSPVERSCQDRKIRVIRVLTTPRRVRSKALRVRRARLAPPHLALWRMTYYSGLTPAKYSKGEIASPYMSGPRGIRTPDLLNAIETRSQLRYGPLVDLGGFEPPTSSVRLRRAPNCATGPATANEIVPDSMLGVKQI